MLQSYYECQLHYTNIHKRHHQKFNYASQPLHHTKLEVEKAQWMLDMDIKHSLQFVIVHFGSEIITKAMNNRCHAFELGTMGTKGVFKGMHGTTLSGYQDILHSLPYHTRNYFHNTGLQPTERWKCQCGHGYTRMTYPLDVSIIHKYTKMSIRWHLFELWFVLCVSCSAFPMCNLFWTLVNFSDVV